MTSVSLASSPTSCLNLKEPEEAMMPRLFSRSSLSMPMPLSETVRVRPSLSTLISILKSLRLMPTESSVRAL